jgi:acyl-coenzyme A thioesterase PaaI-like protein
MAASDAEEQDPDLFGGRDPFDQWAEPEGYLTPERVAARAAADAIRGLIGRLAATSASVEQLVALTERLERVIDALPPGATPGGPGAEQGVAEASMAVGDLQRLDERSPVIGRANPVAPPLRLAFVDGRIEATVTFGRAYEGPPGSVHGGWVAAVFDEALGAAQAFSGKVGMTARLVVDYRSPTPLDTELRVRCDMVSVDGRKVLCTGKLWAGDQLCAEAEGLFIAIDMTKLMEMLERRAGNSSSG